MNFSSPSSTNPKPPPLAVDLVRCWAEIVDVTSRELPPDQENLPPQKAAFSAIHICRCPIYLPLCRSGCIQFFRHIPFSECSKKKKKICPLFLSHVTTAQGTKPLLNFFSAGTSSILHPPFFHRSLSLSTSILTPYPLFHPPCIAPTLCASRAPRPPRRSRALHHLCQQLRAEDGWAREALVSAIAMRLICSIE